MLYYVNMVKQMKKIIKKIGNSLGIIFNREERKIHKINENQVVDIEIKCRNKY